MWFCCYWIRVPAVTPKNIYAPVVRTVVRHPAKVKNAGSIPVWRSKYYLVDRQVCDSLITVSLTYPLQFSTTFLYNAKSLQNIVYIKANRSLSFVTLFITSLYISNFSLDETWMR